MSAVDHVYREIQLYSNLRAKLNIKNSFLKHVCFAQIMPDKFGKRATNYMHVTKQKHSCMR